VGDLLERRRARAAALGTRVEVADSQWIKRLGYDKSTQTMVMVTARSLYGFAVPPEVYQAMSESHSPGRVYNQVVKGRAARLEVRECPRCHRYSTAGPGHRCPPREGPRDVLGVDVNRLHRQAGAGRAIRGD
jgi:hypothetical protein